jgi:5-methylcytosine-specific restriction endonuclease McrA
MTPQQNRPKDHRQAQKQVKELEGYECMVCGQVIKSAHGHHLIPYSEGGAANLQNMTTFCPECHRQYHSGQLNIDIYRT